MSAGVVLTKRMVRCGLGLLGTDIGVMCTAFLCDVGD